MDKEICKKVITRRNELVPWLFTSRQVDLLQKYLAEKKLTPGERTYLYGAISKKINALQLLKEEYYITGQEMIPERVAKAKEILKELGKENAFISGSFLYKKDYKDIDVFILGKRSKHTHKGKLHLNFLTESDLKKPLFCSAAKYSVSNFSLAVKPLIKREELSEIFLTYQLAINEILNGEDQKTARQLIFYHALSVKKEVLNSYALYRMWKEFLALPQEEKIQQINRMAKEILQKSYSPRYCSQGVQQFQQSIEKIIKEYPADNLSIYLNFVGEVQDACRRAEA